MVFVAASTDQEREKVQPYIDEMNFSFPVAYAEDTATKFGVEGIPSLFIIGPQGKIRYKIVGFDLAVKSEAIFKSYGYDVTLYDFEGGHEVNTETIRKVEQWIENMR